MNAEKVSKSEWMQVTSLYSLRLELFLVILLYVFCIYYIRYLSCAYTVLSCNCITLSLVISKLYYVISLKFFSTMLFIITVSEGWCRRAWWRSYLYILSFFLWWCYVRICAPLFLSFYACANSTSFFRELSRYYLW